MGLDAPSGYFWSDWWDVKTVLGFLKMFHKLTTIVKWPDEQTVRATRRNESIIRTKSKTLHTVRFIYMGRELILNLALVKVPNFYDTILPTCSKQSVADAWTTPLNLVNSAFEVLEDKVRFWLLWLPQTHSVLRTATSQDISTRVPLNLLNFILVTTHPHLLRRRRRFNIPVINLLAFTSDRKAFVVLPVDLKSVQPWVKLWMV